MTLMLADYHHHDLWESLELMCARLGWGLARPIGMDWFEQGYWNFERAWHGDAVARQYLLPWGSDGGGRRWDPSHGRWQRLLTLEEARDLRPDVVVASVAHNHEGLHRFASEAGATFGIHLGNVRFSAADMAEDRWDLASFGIVTTRLPVEPSVPHEVVHQEFSLDDFRHERRPEPHEGVRVSSFVNCFAENLQGYGQFLSTAAQRPAYDWRVYGSYGSTPPDAYAAGNIGTCAGVADAMRASDVAWHTKIWSDGFGHVVHDWFAVGRPVLGYASYYRDQLAGPLWVEGETSFDLTGMDPAACASLVDRLANDEELRLRMGDAAAARFREVVDFDEEELRLRALFARVLP